MKIEEGLSGPNREGIFEVIYTVKTIQRSDFLSFFFFLYCMNLNNIFLI